jgi:hypothetical protein
MEPWQFSVWLASLCLASFAAGCSFAVGFKNSKARKASHARKR